MGRSRCGSRNRLQGRRRTRRRRPRAPPPPFPAVATLAALCLEHYSASSCAGWEDLCLATHNGTAFPALCSGAVAAPAPVAPSAKAYATDYASGGAGAPAPAPWAAAAPLAGGGSAASCYADPSAAECASFVRPDSENTADIQALCSSMPSMAGCTLWRACTGGACARHCPRRAPLSARQASRLLPLPTAPRLFCSNPASAPP